MTVHQEKAYQHDINRSSQLYIHLPPLAVAIDID